MARSILTEDYILHSEVFYSYRIKVINSENLTRRREIAVETYMLCPQFGTIQYCSDTERFINWLSELQIGSQYR